MLESQAFPLTSQHQGPPSPKRLIPMAKPRVVTPQAATLNNLGYDQLKSKSYRAARQLLMQERYRKYKIAALAAKQGDPLPGGGTRLPIESLLMRRRRKKKELSRMQEAQKYRQNGGSRQDLRRGMMSNAEVRRIIEREATSFGEMCTRMEQEGGDKRRERKEAQYDSRGRAIGMGPNPMYPPEAGMPWRRYKDQMPGKPTEVGGNWIPPQKHQSVLPQAPLTVDDVDDRQLVAKEVDLCIQNVRTLLSSAKEVLVLAESDFSFSSALVDFLPKGSHMVATSFESEEKLQELHKEKLENHLKILNSHHATVLHDIDARCIEETLDAAIRKRSPEEQEVIRSRWSGHFDLVWIQLPHTGGTAKTNSTLIERFLSTVGRALKPNGLIFMTLYGMQVDHWKVAQHAQAAELVHVFKIPFNTSIYPAIWTRYNPKVGFSNSYFDILRHPCESFVFAQNEFTCVSKLKAVDSKILSGLRMVKINTIGDLAEADRRLLSDDVDPKFIRLIHQAKAWMQQWMQLQHEIPQLLRSLPLDNARRAQPDLDGGGRYGENHYY